MKGKKYKEPETAPGLWQGIGGGHSTPELFLLIALLGLQDNGKVALTKRPTQQTKTIQMPKSGFGGAGHNLGWRGVYSKTEDYC